MGLQDGSQMQRMDFETLVQTRKSVRGFKKQPLARAVIEETPAVEAVEGAAEGAPEPEVIGKGPGDEEEGEGGDESPGKKGGDSSGKK